MTAPHHASSVVDAEFWAEALEQDFLGTRETGDKLRPDRHT